MSKINKKIFQVKVKIASNHKIQGRYFKMHLISPRIAKIALPGQFLEVKVSDNYEPLLRKPFSIHKLEGAKIEILYEVIGKGTELLSKKRKGVFLDLLGPLGNGFNYQLPITNYQLPMLVAGGIGVAPLLFLAERLQSKNIIVLIGARRRSEILCKNDFKKLGCDVRIATDNGSEGFRGKVTGLLKSILVRKNYRLRASIYACGPAPMLKKISQISQRYEIPAQGSLEAYMACGFGVCLGCAVNTKAGYKLVCKDGPVFNLNEIAWL